MATSRRVHPDEGFWPDAQASRDRLNEFAARSEQAKANMHSRERRNALLDVAGIEPEPEMSRMPAVADPLPTGGVSAEVIARARELGRNPDAANRETSLRWEERVRADERERVQRELHPEQYGDTLQQGYDDLDPEVMPGDDEAESTWNYGSPAYGADEVEEASEMEQPQLTWEEQQYNERQAALRETYDQQQANQQAELAQGQLEDGEAGPSPEAMEAWGAPH
jgi:hypothetical protein